MNATMDAKSSWERLDKPQLRQALAARSNLRLCVDGGMRSNSLGALGMVLYAVTTSAAGSSHHLIARKGILLEQLSSAFLAEAMALEAALEYISEMLVGNRI